MNDLVADKVMNQLRVLPTELQWRVLEFTRALAVSSRGRSRPAVAGVCRHYPACGLDAHESGY